MARNRGAGYDAGHDRCGGISDGLCRVSACCLCRPCNQLKTDRHIDYRTDERRRKAEEKGGCGRQPPTDLENLAAATGALDIARLHWYEALSAAVTAGHPKQVVAAAAGMSPAAPSPMIRQEVAGQP